MSRWSERALAGALAGGCALGMLCAVSATADQQTITVTLPTGQTMTTTVEVPAPTPVDQVPVPPVTTPVGGVETHREPNRPAPAAPPRREPGPGPAGPRKRARRHRSEQPDAATVVRRVLQRPRRAVRPTRPPPREATPLRAADGTPTPLDPTYSYALPGPAPIGVPNFFIDRFRIPPFLLSIYQAAGIEYGIRWEILAAINEIETDYGRNLNVSSAGAEGWMQFLPSTWKRWAVDANGDREKDPYNPADAIFTAARYLSAAGVDADIRKAVFAYNHAGWYVDSVLMRARLIGGMPADLVGSLTGLTEGHFPVHAPAKYARGAGRTPDAINLFARAGSPAIAVQDGKIVRMGASRALGRFVELRDVYGNTYTYSGLRSTARSHVVIRDRHAAAVRPIELPKRDAPPASPATAGHQLPVRPHRAGWLNVLKERLYAHPKAPRTPRGLGRYLALPTRLRPSDYRIVRLRPGSRVIGGTILGRLGVTHAGIASHLRFQIRPAGRGAPLINPKPILDGWKLLESTALYRAAGANPFFGPDARNPSIGQILLMSKEALQRRVLDDPDLDIYPCGRRDIASGAIDKRVLATLEFLSASGLKPTVSALRCGHSPMTASGNISEHSFGDAVDISRINGIPIAGHQGPGSITDITIRRLLTLQGTMKPHQIISLMSFDGADNTLALSDHADHIHVGFRPVFDPRNRAGVDQLDATLKPGQWTKLIARLGRIDNPAVGRPDS